ncbi:transmembrane gamma-carboxyglutamic acid protein 4 [Salarias fasciatus]|uniref:Gla domain-containing protein n=1 Tax=Salarias fasciatus TaxID=181472 RepID=A0A672FT78_SALFA|nr:transmembrane gamma-carboxyglutamic acid protein 4 [Salarias fasciatus]XP_029948624.1 transmembrane gamma-carboxyglutamic acid protein 4 [Salarias fasciatus]
MLLRLLVLSHLLTRGDLVCLRTLFSKPEESQEREVFVDEGDANSFLGRHLLFNRFDFEVFVPGNLERECYEEVCNYEEAREVFENVQLTNEFWKKYISDGNDSSRVDVTSLLVGLITSGVALIVAGLLVWYFCQGKCKNNLSRGNSVPVRRRRRSNATLIMRRLEEVSLQPAPGGPSQSEEADPPGLPSYEQAIASCGPHDAPPPPYPGSRSGSIPR